MMYRFLLNLCLTAAATLSFANVSEAQTSGSTHVVQAHDDERPPPVDTWTRDAKPSTGLAGRIVGWIGVGVTGLNLATLPLCTADVIPEEERQPCRARTFAVAGTFGTIGLIALVTGYSKKAKHRRWLEQGGRYRVQHRLLPELSAGHARLDYRLEF